MLEIVQSKKQDLIHLTHVEIERVKISCLSMKKNKQPHNILIANWRRTGCSRDMLGVVLLNNCDIEPLTEALGLLKVMDVEPAQPFPTIVLTSRGSGSLAV